MIPTFIKIPTASDRRAMTGYEFNEVPASVNRDAYRRMYSDTEMELSERISDDIDGFYDGFDSLAVTPDGQLYHVLFSWETGEPLIWCPIHPVQGRYLADDQYSACVQISIHIPRTGDDPGGPALVICPYISIHIPRTGDDQAGLIQGGKTMNFNPHPPHGG